MTTLHAVEMAPQTQVITHQHQQQQQQRQEQQTITYQTVKAQPQQARTTVNSHYSTNVARQTGYTQVTCGVLSVSIGIAAIVLGCRISMVGSPIWSGIGFFIVAGILGIASAANQNNCVIIGHMVMSILASLAAFQLMCVMIVAALTEYGECYNEYNIYGLYRSNCDNNYGRIAVDSFGAVVGLVEFIVAIIASATCCRGSCGSETIATQQTVVHHYVPNQGNLTIMTNPQPYGQAVPQQQGYIQQPHPMAPPQGYANQAFNQGPQSSHGAPPIHAPPPYNYNEEKGQPGMPIAEA